MSDPGMDGTLYETPSMHRFTGLSLMQGSIPDETTILNFHHLLETHSLGEEYFDEVATYLGEQVSVLREAIIVDASLIEASISAKNKLGKRDPEHQASKGKHWYLEMKVYFGLNGASGLIQSLVNTTANVNNVTQTDKLPMETRNGHLAMRDMMVIESAIS